MVVRAIDKMGPKVFGLQLVMHKQDKLHEPHASISAVHGLRHVAASTYKCDFDPSRLRILDLMRIQGLAAIASASRLSNFIVAGHQGVLSHVWAIGQQKWASQTQSCFEGPCEV